MNNPTERVLGIGGLFFRSRDPKNWRSGINSISGLTIKYGNKPPARPRSLRFRWIRTISGRSSKGGW